MAKYLEAFPDRDLPSVLLKGVWVLSDTTTVVRLGAIWDDLLIEEYWNGCEFLGSSEWWPEP